MNDTGQSVDDPLWYTRFHKQTGVSQQFDDWHPEMFKNFDPQAWVETIVSTGADSCHIQAKCHAGNAYYVTDIDHLHMGYRGQDAFGILLDGLHKKGVKVFANYSTLYDNRLFLEHPDWRMRDADGRDSKQLGWSGHRTGVVCFNTPYRDLARKQLEAFALKYRPDAMFLDMVFAWITVCYCQYCQERYRADTGRELPTKDDRSSQAFRDYVKWRNNCLYEFTEDLIGTFKAIHPDVPLMFNSPRPHLAGPISTLKMAGLMDYVGGDPVQADPAPALISYSASASANMKPDRVALMAVGRFHTHEGQHTGTRSVDEMTVAGLVSAAHNCAYQLFDNCNADGTLYASPFRAFKEVFARLRPIEPLLGGDKIRLVGVYVSEDTKNYLYESRSGEETQQHVSGLQQTFKGFYDDHIPVDVITKLNLDQLDQYGLLCLSDALCLTDEEIEAIRGYVHKGGKLLATRFSSLGDKDGNLRHNFALADVFGVDYLGQTENIETYIAVDPELCHKAGIPDDQEVKVDVQAIVRAREGTQVLGRMVLPYTNRANDRDRWIGCWASPPEIETDDPCIVLNDYGRGQCCYFSGRLTTLSPWPGRPHRQLHSVEEPRKLLSALGRSMLGDDIPLTIEAPLWVTVTGYQQAEKGRIVVHLVNCQRDMPILPVRDLQVILRLEGDERVTTVTAEPDTKALAFQQEGSVVTITMPEIQLYQAAVVGLG